MATNYMKLSFRNVQDLMTARAMIKPVVQKNKRDKKGGPRNEKMEDRVRRVGKEFFPVGFETSGASTSQSSS